MAAELYSLSVTTQGPLYPPSEIMDQDGNFVVIGRIPGGEEPAPWAAAIVSGNTSPPHFGEQGEYEIVRLLDLEALAADTNTVLHTLPLPLPANNYRMLFAPEQRGDFQPSCPNDRI
nr:hypothetical protein [uncultured Halomonas sp.]